MKLSQLRSRCRPHLWYQLYWVVYLIWFFWLDLTVTAPIFRGIRHFCAMYTSSYAKHCAC